MLSMVDNILACWHNATAADLESGLSWYSRAQEHANALATGTEYSVIQTAGVIAALSPRNPWPTNSRDAALVVGRAAAGGTRPPTVAGFKVNADKAWAILQLPEMLSDAELLIEVLDIIDPIGRAPKVHSFYLNILGDLQAVTVDVWAGRAAGDPRADRGYTKRQYTAIADAYREAAVILDVAPRDVQAAVWVYARRTALTDSLRHAWILEREQ